MKLLKFKIFHFQVHSNIKHYLKAVALQRGAETHRLLGATRILAIFILILIHGVLSHRLLEFIPKSRDCRILAFMCVLAILTENEKSLFRLLILSS